MLRRFFPPPLLLLSGILGALAPAASTGAETLEIACEKMAGNVRFDIRAEAGALLFTVTYPKNVGSYLGGFTNGTKGAGADVKLYLDTDANPATGMKADPMFAAGAGGSEFSIETQEIETSVAKDASGNWINRPVLMVMVQKQDEFFDLPGGVSPKWEIETGGRFRPIDWMTVPESKAMRLAFPIAAIGLKPGGKVRVTAVVPLCMDKFPFPGTKETTIILQ